MNDTGSSSEKKFTAIEIKPKCSIKVYCTPNAGRNYFTVGYYDEEGKRQRRLFRDLATAEKEADKLAGKLGKNQPTGLLVTGRDRLIYERALDAARSTGLDLDILAKDAPRPAPSSVVPRCSMRPSSTPSTRSRSFP